MWNHLRSLNDAPPQLLREIEHFFTIYKDLEKKKTGVEGWYGLDEAIRAIEEARQAFVHGR
jgi:inorganic pyrophosphatase